MLYNIIFPFAAMGTVKIDYMTLREAHGRSWDRELLYKHMEFGRQSLASKDIEIFDQ
jgi:hypothetical protein